MYFRFLVGDFWLGFEYFWMFFVILSNLFLDLCLKVGIYIFIVFLYKILMVMCIYELNVYELNVFWIRMFKEYIL